MQATSSIVVLVRNEAILMQLTLIGSLLVNILLLPALSIFYATYQGKDMVHDHEVTKKYTLLLFLATSGFIAPTVFDRETNLPDSTTAGISRAASVLLIFTYAAYLVFQLLTHKNFYKDPLPDRHHPIPISGSRELMIEGLQRSPTPQLRENGELELSASTASFMFLATTALVYLSVDYFVDSVLDLGMRADYPGFCGYILIPVLNSDIAAIGQVEQSMDMVLAFTLDKSLQLSLFVWPCLVVVAWGMGIDAASLSLDIPGVTVLFVSVYLVNALSALGKFNWSVDSI